MSEWAHCHVDRVRFADLDAMRHLNNAAFLTFFESARVEYISRLLGDDPTTRGQFGVIFAECKIRYRAPAFLDEEIRTCVRPAEIARSSVKLEFAMHSTADERLLADGYGTIVGYDYGAGRAAPLPEPFKAALGTSFKMPAASQKEVLKRAPRQLNASDHRSAPRRGADVA